MKLISNTWGENKNTKGIVKIALSQLTILLLTNTLISCSFLPILKKYLPQPATYHLKRYTTAFSFTEKNNKIIFSLLIVSFLF